CKRRQAGRVNINRAGRYRGSKRRMVGVTSQVQQRRMVRQARDQSRVSRESDRNRKQGPGETQHQGRVCRSECPLNTPV
ncbi:unnamed protein product, partial [Staurois parvus]